jgi:hypothetical protein
VRPPQPDLLVSIVKAAHPPRLQHRCDLSNVVPLRPGERQSHVPPPIRYGSVVRASVYSRHDIEYLTERSRRPEPLYTA